MNKRLILSLGLLGILLSAGWAGATPAQAVPQGLLLPVGAPTARAAPQFSLLVINEVFAPSVAAPTNQYFELYNGTTNAIDLSSYVVFNSGGSDALNVLPNTTIAARSLLVVSASQLGNQIGSSLNPASDFLALVQRGATDNVIDVVNWGAVNPNWPNYAQFAPYFFVSNAPTMPTDGLRSLQRYPNGFDSDQPTDFVALQSSPAQPVPTFTPTPIVTATATATGLVVTPTATPFCVDGYEPDGSIAQATTLALNTEQTHTICPTGDNDFLSITVVSNKVYSIFTKDLGGSLDTIIAILDSRGNKIAENDDQATCICSRIDMTFPSSGTYYVRVRDNRNLGGIGWVYTVGFSVTPGPAPSGTATATVTPDPNAPTATVTMAPCTDPYENDGVPTAAHLLLIGEVQPGHTFCPAGDADWYKFFGGRGKAYTIQTSGLGIGVDTYLYLFDSDGQSVLAQNDDSPAPPACTSPGPPGCPNDAVASSLDFFPIRDDFYYILVKNKGDLGAPFMNYNVTFRVRANVPVPALTPSPIIAPVVTVTGPPAPTQPPIATAPPIATNPPPAGTATVAPPVPTEAPPAPTDVPPTDVPPLPPKPSPTPEPGLPTAPPAPLPPATATPVIQTPAPSLEPTQEPVPLPPTGHEPDPPAMVTMPLQVYADRNGNGRFDAGEGIYGLHVVFGDSDGRSVPATTSRLTGLSQALLHRAARVTVTIPYLHWTGSAKTGATGMLIRLPSVTLPHRIP